MTEAKPRIRRASRILRVQAMVWDYRHGEKFQRQATVEIMAEEWLNSQTQRYVRRYSARESDRLGWHMAKTPREAILGATNPVQKRGGWIAETCRRASALPYR